MGRLRLALLSGERNAEFFLVGAAVLFIVLAWRSLHAAAFTMPPDEGRILAQFVVTIVAGHLALRAVSPRASPILFAVSALLAAIGLAFTTRLAPSVAQDQANWITIGVAAMVVASVAGTRYPVLRPHRYTCAAAAVALLVITGLFGTTINGARLWITVAGQQVQTTELIKVLLVLFLAGYLADEAAVLSMPRLRFAGRTYSALPYLFPLLVAFAAALGALALLKDLGSIAILILFSVATLYVATGRMRFVFWGLGLLALTSALGYVTFDHVQRRIDTWVDPYSDRDGAGYQSIQALYAIEAGGVTGTGLGLGEPDAIPAAPTDYVFSAVAEELGLAGATGVAMLYVVLVFAGLRVALDLRDTYGRLLVASIALLIAIQAAVIMAGNLRLIPTTGITLPFVSYGGSSLIVNFILVGLVAGASHRGRSA